MRNETVRTNGIASVSDIGCEIKETPGEWISVEWVQEMVRSSTLCGWLLSAVMHC